MRKKTYLRKFRLIPIALRWKYILTKHDRKHDDLYKSIEKFIIFKNESIVLVD